MAPQPSISTKKIGVISSIECGQSFTDALEGALNYPVTYYFDKVGYDNQLLKDAVNSFNADTNIGLIVTFGGKIAFAAANSFAKKPFISLTGAPPTTSDNRTDYCLGGVSLESYVHNQPIAIPVTFGNGTADVTVTDGSNPFKVDDRVSFTGGNLPNNVPANQAFFVTTVGSGTFQFSATKGGGAIQPASAASGINAWSIKNRIVALKKDPSNISLLYHSASSLIGDELAQWRTNWPALDGYFKAGPGGPAIPINVRKKLVYAFDDVPTDAVIISADPYFQENKEELIQAANASSKLVCYPLNNYRNRSGKNKPSHAVVYGPKLEEAITQIGSLANTFLAVTGANTITQQPFTPIYYPDPK
ncbi:MAG TPA: hypothetical protein VH678_27060 [Xanthobacteraceae bacterium]|jgi:hypothetical protein